MQKSKKKIDMTSKNEGERSFFYPPRDIVCTRAFSNFLLEYHSNFDSFFYIASLAIKSDDVRVRAANLFVRHLSANASDEERERHRKAASDLDAAWRQLRKFAPLLSRNLTNTAVSGVQRYFSEIIQTVALKKPEILKSAQTLRVDEILNFNNHKDLVAYLIDRKINELSYGGLDGVEEYFSDRLGIKMFTSDQQRTLLKVFFELRNINVHSGGIVNDLFLRRVGQVDGFQFVRGECFHVDMDELEKLAGNAIQIALEVDRSTASKFKLRRKAHDIWAGSRI